MFKNSSASIDLVKIFDAFYSSVVLLDSRRRIVCCNETFARLVGAARPQDLVDKDFYTTLKKPLFTDGDYCPLHFVATRGVRTQTFFEVPGVGGEENKRFYEMIAAPFTSSSGEQQFLVDVQDVTETTRDDRRLEGLSEARADLYRLLDEAVSLSLTREQRVAKLKNLIQRHMRATLRYDVYEMRLLEPTKKLTPFLSIGMPPNAQERVLYASPSKNGVTGYVASSGEDYICDDVKNDLNYIEGAIDAASSLTLPVLYLTQVIGVVNIESRTPNAFTRRDVRFLKLYLADLAQILRRLELLETETVHARGECAQELRELFFAASADVVGSAFERRVQKRPQTEAEELETNGYIQGVRDASRRLRPTVKRLTNKWIGRSIEPPKNAALLEELQNNRVLLVARDRRFLEFYVDLFELYGLVVDVATNTSVALAMTRTFEYDFILCERNPDGEYFTEEEKDSAKGRNEFGCNRFDIHLPNYDAPIADDPRDAEIRRRVASHIADGKLDAYFFYVELQKLRLERAPQLLVFVDDGYDPTHILRDLSAHFQFKPFLVSTALSMEKQIAQLVNGVRKRDA